MTFEEIVSAVRPAVPKTDAANAEAIARAHVNKAIRRIGRLDDVYFNKVWDTFTLTSGTSSYDLGEDVLKKYDVFYISRLWDTSTRRNPIEIVGIDDFNSKSRGMSSSGWPLWGTVHSKDATLEVYPIPDADYTVGTYLKTKVTSLDDIGDAFHDIIIDCAVLSLRALTDSQIAFKMANDGINDAQASSRTKWRGNQFSIQRHLAGTSTTGPDSQNLGGD